MAVWYDDNGGGNMNKVTIHDDHIKHLEFIQNAINRMSKNSFQIKGWMLMIMSALLALYANTGKNTYIIMLVIPVILFWSLDAYYLQQERKFRGLYNDVVATTSFEKNTIECFDMSIERYHSEEYSYFRVFFSKTLIGLYGTTVFCLFLMAMCNIK